MCFETVHSLQALAIGWGSRAPRRIAEHRIDRVCDSARLDDVAREYLQATIVSGKRSRSLDTRMDDNVYVLLVEIDADRRNIISPEREVTYFVDAAMVAAGVAACGFPGRDPDTLPASSYDHLLATAVSDGGFATELLLTGLRRLIAVSDDDPGPEEGSETAREHAVIAPITDVWLNGLKPWAELTWPLLVAASLQGDSAAAAVLRELIVASERLGPSSVFGNALRIWRYWFEYIFDGDMV